MAEEDTRSAALLAGDRGVQYGATTSLDTGTTPCFHIKGRNTGTRVQLRLTAECFEFKVTRASTWTRVPMHDIVGAKRLASYNGLHGALFGVYAYPLKTAGCCSSPVRQREEYVFRIGDNQSESFTELALQWADAVARTCRGLSAADSLARRMCVVVNPVGGKGDALPQYRRRALPILEDAGIEVIEEVTTHAAHATEIAAAADFSRITSLIGVGGDGLMTEIVQGLMNRPDWATAATFPMGILPGGSGNGLAKSILHAANEPYSYESAAFLVAKGGVSPVDISVISTPQHTYFSFLSLAWGLISDIDIESEYLRCLGNDRFTAHAIVRAVALRKYRGTLWYLPDSAESVQRVVNAAGTAASPSVAAAAADAGADAEVKVSDVEAGALESKATEGRKLDHLLAPPLSQAVPANWQCVSGSFVTIWGMNITHASLDTLPAPDAKLCDGYIQLLVVRECGRVATIRMLLGLEDGTFSEHPACETIRTKAWRLVPEVRPDRAGCLSMDGESIPYGPCQMEAHRGVVQFYAAPPA